MSSRILYFYGGLFKIHFINISKAPERNVTQKILDRRKFRGKIGSSNPKDIPFFTKIGKISPCHVPLLVVLKMAFTCSTSVEVLNWRSRSGLLTKGAVDG
jgi:hypothetical protein